MAPSSVASRSSGALSDKSQGENYDAARPEEGGAASGSRTSVPDSSSERKKKATTKKAPPHQVLTDRDEIPRLWNPQKSTLIERGSYPMRIVSWNVCGLRALLAKTPDALVNLVKEHDVDVLCLQETKLQASHVADLALTDCVPGYDAYFSCSVARKGYSGTAAFVRKRTGVSPTVVENGTNSKPSEASGSYAQKSGKKQKTLEGFFTSTTKKNIQTSIQAADDRDESAEGALGPTDVGSGPLPPDASRLLVPERVSFGMGLDVHDGEGRMVIMEFPLFTVCNLYVPNSGQALARLSYRVDEWDKDWLKYCLEKRRSSGRPLVWLGDLNVAHTRLEVWNDGAKHLPKQAGVTPEERASFQHQLDASGFVDAFRHLHPEARGHYSYWSQRAGNRQPNKGLRLDYFVCDPSLFVPPPRDCPGGGVSGGGNVADVDARTISSRRAVVRDSYILHDVQGSDHCPVVLEIEVMLS